MTEDNIGKFGRDLVVVAVGAALLALADHVAGFPIPEYLKPAVAAAALYAYREGRVRGWFNWAGANPK